MSVNLKKLNSELKRAFSQSAKDPGACTRLLPQAKLALVEAGLLVPLGDHPRQDLIMAREILEIGAFHSIRTRDITSFDRFFSQLQNYYTDCAATLAPSPRQYPLQGLNLIRLLTQNRIADFHTTLEGLPADVLQDNPFIRHPVNLERWMMEGSYSKVWNARSEAPAEEYKLFVESLMGTIRNEIASCEEAAYNSLPVNDAVTLLFFTNQHELMLFAQQRHWQVDLVNRVILFPRKGENGATEIPTKKVISQALTCARELEQIV